MVRQTPLKPKPKMNMNSKSVSICSADSFHFDYIATFGQSKCWKRGKRFSVGPNGCQCSTSKYISSEKGNGGSRRSKWRRRKRRRRRTYRRREIKAMWIERDKKLKMKRSLYFSFTSTFISPSVRTNKKIWCGLQHNIKSQRGRVYGCG